MPHGRAAIPDRIAHEGVEGLRFGAATTCHDIITQVGRRFVSGDNWRDSESRRQAPKPRGNRDRPCCCCISLAPLGPVLGYVLVDPGETRVLRGWMVGNA